MKSMTGYGASQAKGRELGLEVHVKSVNGRFLELRFHLPKEYAPFENGFRKLFATWTRGTIDIYVHRRVSAESKLQGLNVRASAAKHWLSALSRLKKDLKLNDDIRLHELLQLPQVLEVQERTQLFPGELELATRHIAAAIERCEKLRRGEGAQLKKELQRLLRELSALVEKIADWRAQATTAAEARLKSRLAGLEAEALDPARLALETALLIDKMDVHEELVRLREHIKACTKLIQANEARGKKLDFYCQELLREVNTIGSKSQLASLTAVVVDAKSLIEKFREQVQNIE